MAKMPYEVWSLKKGLRLKRWIIGLLIFLLASLLAMNSFTIGQFRIIPLGNNSFQASNAAASLFKIRDPRRREPTAAAAADDANTSPTSSSSGYVVRTEGCHIPDLNPFEPAMMRYYDRAKPIVCEQGTQPPLVESNNSAIFVNAEARGYYYNDTEAVECCWRSFWRTPDKDNEVTISRDCHPFQEAAFVNDEFVRVECQRRNDTVYRDYFAFVPRKLQVEERCRARRRGDYAAQTSRGHQSGQRRQQPPPSNSSSSSTADSSGIRRRPLGVLVVGVDAVSRLNLHRSMPSTVELLRDWGAVEMLGYNKVADNTYPNLVPVLSGHDHEEFERLCWRDRKLPFDDCPFVWRRFRDAGYRTIFAEDACSMTTFNYLKPGFRTQPTDYYLRPYCIAAETEIGNTHRLNANLCLGTRLNFENLLLYARKVAEEFADDPYFAFVWQTSLTHDYLEYPQLGERAYTEFFRYLRDGELMRDTALVFMSDHGMRWGAYRQTYQGRLEDSLPFAFLRLPEWWRELYPGPYEELRRNARSLTTPFDLHETLLDLLEPARLREKELSNEIPTTDDQQHPSSPAQPPPRRGISFFKPVPGERTCESAGIPEHWCMCHPRRNVSLADPIVPRLADYLVGQLNQLLAAAHRQPPCAVLAVEEVRDVKAMQAGEEAGGTITKTTTTRPTLMPSAGPQRDAAKQHQSSSIAAGRQPYYWTDYSVTLVTRPGGAVFEGSIRLRPDNASSTMSLVGTVSRLNAYGNQSSCVDDFHLRLYCYCLR